MSYASQDAEAARRIVEALLQGGIEVWFDQSELRGGEAWDASIRRQIKGCKLFMPVISANTQSREEGYFRREWNLAVGRTLDMADDTAFLLPVVIDSTSDADARVPPESQRKALRPIPLLIFSSRWLQLPLYIGLIVAQGVYVVLFVKELWHLVLSATTFTASGSEKSATGGSLNARCPFSPIPRQHRSSGCDRSRSE